MTPEGAASGRPDLSRVTVLEIDHDMPSIQLLTACLVPFGARVLSARSAGEAKNLENVLTRHHYL